MIKNWESIVQWKYYQKIFFYKGIIEIATNLIVFSPIVGTVFYWISMRKCSKSGQSQWALILRLNILIVLTFRSLEFWNESRTNFYKIRRWEVLPGKTIAN